MRYIQELSDIFVLLDSGIEESSLNLLIDRLLLFILIKDFQFKDGNSWFREKHLVGLSK